MINLKAVRKRAIKAVDSLVNYLPLMKMEGDEVIIQKQETYRVNMVELTCTCEDFARRGYQSPCKHLFLSLVYVNALNHEEQEDL